MFGPLAQPTSQYIHLPETVRVEWIGSEDDVPKLAALQNEKLVGVDSEWRPEIT